MYKPTIPTKPVDKVQGKDQAVTEMVNRGTFLKRGMAGLGLGVLRGGPAAARAASTRSLDTTLNLVAYSTPKPVMSKIISDFQATPAGQGVNFSQSYGASTGTQKTR